MTSSPTPRTISTGCISRRVVSIKGLRLNNLYYSVIYELMYAPRNQDQSLEAGRKYRRVGFQRRLEGTP